VVLRLDFVLEGEDAQRGRPFAGFHGRE
jgi:hypothetical protein